MTSTCDGINGSSFGFINVQGIEDTHRFYGGEDHWELFSDYLTLSMEQPLDCEVAEFELRFQRHVHRTDWNGTSAELEICRTVRLLDNDGVCAVFGQAVAASVGQADVSYVSFETENTAINRAESPTAPAISCSHCLFNANPYTVAVLPFRTGSEEELGQPYDVEYFGTAPHGRLRRLPGGLLLKADGKGACQITLTQKRALPLVGSIDFRAGFLTLIVFDVPPPQEWQPEYMAEENETNDGDNIVRAVNRGSFTGYYGFDFFSLPQQWDCGESLVHSRYTIHINADNETLAYLVDHLFGIDYEEIYRKIIC